MRHFIRGSGEMVLLRLQVSPTTKRVSTWCLFKVSDLNLQPESGFHSRNRRRATVYLFVDLLILFSIPGTRRYLPLQSRPTSVTHVDTLLF